jgi:hypothetical protein
MRRILLTAALLAVCTAPASALMIAFRPPTQRAITAEVVCIGKITAIEKDTVDAAQFPGSPIKAAHKIAVVKIETPLAGAAGVTHVKIGFVPPPPPARPDPNVPRPPIRRPGPQAPELKEGQEYVFFLNKHASGDFYTMPMMSPAIPGGTDEAKKEVAKIQKVLATLAEPMKGLKSDKAEERYLTASTLLTRYRTYPDAGEPAESLVPAEESRLILKGLLDADWTKFDADLPNPAGCFYSLGLTAKDDWAPPKPAPVKPGEPRVNHNNTVKAAFAAWLDGPGKNYQIKKLTPKK